MGQSRCVSKTCRELLQATDGERKISPTRQKKEKKYIYIKHHQLDVSLLGQHSWM